MPLDDLDGPPDPKPDAAFLDDEKSLPVAPPREYEHQYVAITFDDGSVGIMGFITNPRLPPESRKVGYDHRTGQREATDEAIQSEINESQWGEVTPVSWQRIESRDVPKDVTYRDAWTWRHKGIEHDMAKAKEICRDHLRHARAPILAALDTAYLRADEAGDSQEKRRIAAEKQRLRDITDHPDIEKATTIEEMRAAVRIDA